MGGKLINQSFKSDLLHGKLSLNFQGYYSFCYDLIFLCLCCLSNLLFPLLCVPTVHIICHCIAGIAIAFDVKSSRSGHDMQECLDAPCCTQVSFIGLHNLRKLCLNT